MRMVIAMAVSMAVLMLQVWSLNVNIWWLAYICIGAYGICLIAAQSKEAKLRDRISALEEQLTKKGDK